MRVVWGKGPMCCVCVCVCVMLGVRIVLWDSAEGWSGWVGPFLCSRRVGVSLIVYCCGDVAVVSRE